MRSWNEIFDNRCDKIGQALSQDEECAKLFNAVIHTQEALREKLSNGESALIDQLEEAYSELIELIEQAYYLGGRQDGLGINGNVQHVAS